MVRTPFPSDLPTGSNLKRLGIGQPLALPLAAALEQRGGELRGDRLATRQSDSSGGFSRHPCCVFPLGGTNPYSSHTAAGQGSGTEQNLGPTTTDRPSDSATSPLLTLLGPGKPRDLDALGYPPELYLFFVPKGDVRQVVDRRLGSYNLSRTS